MSERQEKYPNLKKGENFGNKGGTGRPSSQVRAACREAFERRIATLEAIADDDSEKGPSFGDRIKAIRTFGDFGLAQRVEVNIANEEVFDALTELLPQYFEEEATCQRFMDDLDELIKSNAG